MQPLKDSSHFKRVILFQKSVWREQEQAHLRSLEVQVYLIYTDRQEQTINTRKACKMKNQNIFKGALGSPKCQNALFCDNFFIHLCCIWDSEFRGHIEKSKAMPEEGRWGHSHNKHLAEAKPRGIHFGNALPSVKHSRICFSFFSYEIQQTSQKKNKKWDRVF
jgi:hypothetical protein